MQRQKGEITTWHQEVQWGLQPHAKARLSSCINPRLVTAGNHFERIADRSSSSIRRRLEQPSSTSWISC
jgi:hypothetical protein